MPIKGRPIVEVGSLDGRGIGEVDVGHDDRTTLKFGLHFFEQFTLTVNLLTYSLHLLLSYVCFQSYYLYEMIFHRRWI